MELLPNLSLKFKTCDNVYSKTINTESIYLTRYLYFVDEVNIALMNDILQKNSNAFFWAYELVYSGYTTHFFELIWKIYYDFFAVLNPSYEQYLLKKHSDYNKTKDPLIVCAIIQDLLLKPFSTDVFFMHQICVQFDIELEYLPDIKMNVHDDRIKQYKQWIEDEEWYSVCSYTFSIRDTKQLLEIYEDFIDILNIPDKGKLLKRLNNYNNSRSITHCVVVSKILSLLSLKNGNKEGKKIYMSPDEEDIKQFETLQLNNPRKVLCHESVLSINKSNNLFNLFDLVRFKRVTRQMLEDKWLFYASFAPFWIKELQKCKYFVNYVKKEVDFMGDGDVTFYETFCYDFDELPLETKLKFVPDDRDDSPKDTWTTLYERTESNNFIVLTSFDLDMLKNIRVKY